MGNTISPPSNEVILYQAQGMVAGLQVRLENETVWLNRQQIAQLFARDIKTIGKHINNALQEELHGLPTVANFATVQMEGSREVLRNIEYYNLDVIISVGYRVKSQKGIEFRIWANKVLKDYLLKGYVLNQRVANLEHQVYKHEQQIEMLVQQALPPKEGIFFDGQVFDAYKFVNDLVKSAKKSIVLIDNYIDESVLTLFSACKKGVQKRCADCDLHQFNFREAKIGH